MLPFMKPKAMSVGVIVRNRKPDGISAEQPDEDSGSGAIDACAEDLMQALQSKDSKAVAAALRAAFEVLESEPHEEAGEEEANDFDSMNEKAAEQSE